MIRNETSEPAAYRHPLFRHSTTAIVEPRASSGTGEDGLASACATMVLFLVLLFSNVWDAPSIVFSGDLPASDDVTPAGDMARQACFILLMLCVIVVGVRSRGLGFLLSVPAFLVPVMIWCWVSVIWAIDPSASLRRIGFTTTIVLSVAYIVQILPYRRIINVMVVCFVLLLLVDWLAVLLMPLAVHQPGELDQSLVGNWRGVHNHKNEAGAFCSLALLLLVHETMRTRSRYVGPTLVLAAGVFLFETRSKTAGGFVAMALLGGMLATLACGSRTLRRVLLLATCVSVLAMMYYADDIAAVLAMMFDDPGALTGRVQIWPILIAYAADHPLLGAGYGSFWAIGNASPIFDYGGGWIAMINHSHNGYLEVLVNTGYVGLALALGGLVMVPLRRLFVSRLPPEMSRSLLCSLILFGLLHDMFETSLLNRSNPTWVVMLIAYCILGQPLCPGHSAVMQTDPARLPMESGWRKAFL